MAYQEGDTSPPHTNVHNDVRTQLDQLSTEFEIPVVLPPAVGLGDVGHVDHHNLFTTAIAELSKHECEDGLEGLGGWAEITEVTGSPKRYAYPDGGTDWVAFEWTADGEVTTTEGLLDMLIVGGGGGIAQPSGTVRHGCGGKVEYGLNPTTAGPHNVVVGGLFSDIGLGSEVQGVCTVGASPSAQNESVALGAGAVVDPGGDLTPRWYGIKSSITGNEIEYARGNETNQPNTGHGSNGDGSGGSSGVVIVRVPAAQAAGVDPGSWVTRTDYYAEVTDGTVTDLYQERFYGDDTVRTENGRYASPEQPDDLIPCDPSVAEGWTYADGEFTPPPPDPSWREQAIEALQEQIKELQKDAK